MSAFNDLLVFADIDLFDFCTMCNILNINEIETQSEAVERLRELVKMQEYIYCDSVTYHVTDKKKYFTFNNPLMQVLKFSSRESMAELLNIPLLAKVEVTSTFEFSDLLLVGFTIKNPHGNSYLEMTAVQFNDLEPIEKL